MFVRHEIFPPFGFKRRQTRFEVSRSTSPDLPATAERTIDFSSTAKQPQRPRAYHHRTAANLMRFIRYQKRKNQITYDKNPHRDSMIFWRAAR